MLYESLIHPLTIISTLPSAGVGALMAMVLFKSDLDIIGMIGIILLIGIVKKNAIMMIDFALAAERNEGLNSRDAIYQACLLRFRPIMMTTMCALLGGMPLALGWGAGAELRKPLGIAIVGGLVVSQMLTLFTTPVIYLYLDRLRKRFARRQPSYQNRPGFPDSRRARGEWRLMTRPWKTRGACAALFCSGCMIGPKYQRPVAQTPPALKELAGNDQWKMATPSDGLIKGKWWEIFGDPQLNQLEELVNVNNQNVKQAEAQFRAGARADRPPITPTTIPPSDPLRRSRKATPGRTPAEAWRNQPELFACRSRRPGSRICGAAFACRWRMPWTTRR